MLKYTRVARCQDGVEVMSMINVVLGKKDMLGYVQDVRAVRGMGQGLSNQHVVLCKVKLVGAWIKMGEVVIEEGKKKNSEWWNEEIRKLILEK